MARFDLTDFTWSVIQIHALVDANGLPIALKLTEGQAHDGRSARDMLATLGDGNVLLADRAYDSDALSRWRHAVGPASFRPVNAPTGCVRSSGAHVRS